VITVPFLDLALGHAEVAGELEAAAGRVLGSGQYIRGPEVEAFEREFADYCAVAGAVGVASGLDALLLALLASGVGEGDEVLVPAHTSIATWLAITHAGARPVPIEPDPDTMLIDPGRVESAIGPRTVAIMPVHLYGMPADMAALTRIASEHGLRLIEDASQAHGARLLGRRVGSLSDVAAFSLYPTKNLGAVGDAGIVVSDDIELLDTIRVLANYGEHRRLHSEVRGRNSRLDELQAALLRVKLTSLDRWNDARRARADQYLDELAGCAEIQLPAIAPGAFPVWHQFVVRVANRDRVRSELARHGVQTLVHYPVAPHRSGAYASDYPDPLPITEQLTTSVISLPIAPPLTEAQTARVGEALLKILTRCPSPVL
jgi:dTDP-4-amino-4,6-dideoxygalactose transaminase